MNTILILTGMFYLGIVMYDPHAPWTWLVAVLGALMIFIGALGRWRGL